jgi:glutamyl-tRNA reductase
MILGEPQILGQIKQAYRTATAVKTSGVILNRLLHRTFSIAKKIRTETGIGDRAVSISYAAVELGRKIFDELQNKKILLIGAGEMAELAVEHLVRNGLNRVFVANRTFESGVSLAKKFQGEAIRFEEIPDHLTFIDIIISSTASTDFVVTRDQVKGVIRSRRNRPLFFIDIAVPRDIDPSINQLSNTYVYDIDDLQDVIDENIEDRKREALKAERMIDEAVIRFREWQDNLAVVPTIVALRKKLAAMAASEMEKTLQGSPVPAEASRAISKMTDSIINKILHDPTSKLKNDAGHSNKALYIDTIRKLFNLDDGGES